MSCNFCRTTPVNPCPICSVAPSSTPIRKVKGTVRAAPRGVTSPRVSVAPAPSVKPSAVIVDAPKAPQASTWSKADVVNVAAAQIAEFYATRQYNIALALLIGLADQSKREDRLSILVLIDQNAKTRGFLSERDDQTRREIGKAAHAEFIAIHGFDPKVPRQTAPKAPVAVKSDGVATYIYPGMSMRVAPAKPVCGKCGAPEAPHTAITGHGSGMVPLCNDCSGLRPVAAPAPSKPLALPAPRGPLKSGDWLDLNRRVDAGELTSQEAEQIGQIWIGAVPPDSRA
jgi:hypothetical protein